MIIVEEELFGRIVTKKKEQIKIKFILSAKLEF
jgi:hypothetical protein